MYVARKNVLENREITLISKGEMSFATETRLDEVFWMNVEDCTPRRNSGSKKVIEYA
jgi:hypothetical protein